MPAISCTRLDCSSNVLRGVKRMTLCFSTIFFRSPYSTYHSCCALSLVTCNPGGFKDVVRSYQISKYLRCHGISRKLPFAQARRIWRISDVPRLHDGIFMGTQADCQEEMAELDRESSYSHQQRDIIYHLERKIKTATTGKDQIDLDNKAGEAYEEESGQQAANIKESEQYQGKQKTPASTTQKFDKVDREEDGTAYDTRSSQYTSPLSVKIGKKRWFPHANAFQVKEGVHVTSETILEMLDPFMMEERKRRIEVVVANRTYTICLVVEGLSDVGNISAICRSADAMGFQSVHVIANCRNLRYRESQRASAGAEKWLDIERWDTTRECIEALQARGYRIAVTHIAPDTVSIHDMDWTVPTAIILGNEHRGISNEAISLSDVRCSIPMVGMVESFNVSVAAGILMHHVAYDRISKAGGHGDLGKSEQEILVADFFMRHNRTTKSILNCLVDRKPIDK